MKINKIRYKNYRCFLEGEVEFPENKENKTINLFVGPNGSGKTELLFSIWWAFYPKSFSFSDMQGKEATDYSLNSDLYFQLKSGPVGGRRECFVEIEFENDDEIYVLKRMETFEKKSPTKITSTLSCSLYTIDKYGITSTPIKDETQINNLLESILPHKVLSGIIFDGERMRKISSINEESAKSIEGVISDITNKEVLVTLDNELNTLKKEYQRSIAGLAKKIQSSDIKEVANKLALKEKELSEKKIKLAKLNNQIPSLEQNLREISEKLQELEESRLIEEKILLANNDLKHYQEKYEESLDAFKKLLSKEGSHIIVKKLITQLNHIIKTTDVPLGLNAKVVENILEKDTCICGNPFNYKMRENLKELQKKLPPNDINATIKEQTKQVQNNANKIRERLDELFSAMDENYKKVHETNNLIVSLKTQLTESVSEKVVTLQTERGKIEERLHETLKRKNNIESENENLIKDIDELKVLQKELTKNQEVLHSLQAKKEFVEKSIKAVEEIQEKYRMIALNEINQLFKDAYKLISEDYAIGRRAYLTHRLRNKYYMVTYDENELINYLLNTKGIEKEKVLTNQIDLDELEKAIDTVKISNSTGQQTVLSLAFVKAILDYSRKEAGEKDRELKKVKVYPVVIDAPFSDLSGENLKNAAANLYNFSNQVILLINQTSYENIKEEIKDHLNSFYYLNKNTEGQYSTIEMGEVTID